MPSELFVRGMDRDPLRLPVDLDKTDPRAVLEFATRSSYPGAPNPLAAVAICAASMLQTMHDEIHAMAGRMKEIYALESELLRLCGPVCPHDGKRAIEHIGSAWLPSGTRLCQTDGCRGLDWQGEHSKFASNYAHPFVAHPEWPEGAQWLRERGK